MPAYEYECPLCLRVKEELKSVREADDLPECEICNKRTRRIMSAGIFKINGFSESNGYSKCQKGA